MSNSDKRSVATDALETLGTFPIPDNSGRDAIHLAVEPVVAGANLNAGERIRIRDGKAYPAKAADASGIVDPFVTGSVAIGQRFWLVVLPRTITSLRHVWSHPLFPEEAGIITGGVAHDKAASEAWLRDFVARSDCPDYYTVIGAALNGGGWDDSGEYLHFDGLDAHGEIPAEFWDHVEIVTGEKVRSRAKYFSCSC